MSFFGQNRTKIEFVAQPVEVTLHRPKHMVVQMLDFLLIGGKSLLHLQTLATPRIEPGAYATVLQVHVGHGALDHGLGHVVGKLVTHCCVHVELLFEFG